MRYQQACLHFHPNLASDATSQIDRLLSTGLLDLVRHRAFRLEERLEIVDWEKLAACLVAKLPTSIAEMNLCFAQALEPCRLSATKIKCPSPKLLVRVQKLRAIAKRAVSDGGPLTSLRSTTADTDRLLRLQIWFPNPTWGAFDEVDSSLDPLRNMKSASEIVSRLALGYTDNPSAVLIVLYTLPDDIDPKIPTLAHAVSWSMDGGVTKSGWHQFFSPTPATASYGRTRPVPPYKCEKGIPETIHDPIPETVRPTYIQKTRRLTYV